MSGRVGRKLNDPHKSRTRIQINCWHLIHPWTSFIGGFQRPQTSGCSSNQHCLHFNDNTSLLTKQLLDFFLLENFFIILTVEGSICSRFRLAAIRSEWPLNFFQFFLYKFRSRSFRAFGLDFWKALKSRVLKLESIPFAW